MNWRQLVLSVMRVPHEPAPPPGSPPKIFRAARNYYKFSVIQFALIQVPLIAMPSFFTIMASVVAAGHMPAAVNVVLQVMQVVSWIVYVTQLVFGWAVLRLNYELRWYMLSDRAIRIREGIATVREKTIALANVQNITIKQGPLQRLLGIADVEVRTAGGSSGGGPHGKGHGVTEPLHVAFFRGVDNAEAIRDLVREGVRRQKDSGLGDPDDHHAPAVHESHADTHAAALELLREARKLRAAFEA